MTAPASAQLGPVPWWSLAAFAGAAGTWWLAWPHPPAGRVVVSLVAGCLVLAVVLLAMTTRGRRRGAAVVAVFLVAAAASTGVLLRLAVDGAGPLDRLVTHGGRAHAALTVVAEPRPIERGWQVVVEVEELDGRAVGRRAAVVLEEQPPALGARWSATVTAGPLPEGGYGRWLRTQHAVAVLDVVDHHVADGPGAAAGSTEWLRERIRRAATRHLDDATGGLLVGFVTGDTRLLSDDDRRAMRQVSLSHLTAVSGTNVALVVGGALALLGLLRAPPWLQRSIIALIVPWFALLTRFEPSVLRAGTMALLLLAARARGHLGDARHALSVAVLLLVLVDPLLAGSLGLLLSGAATAGILIGAEPLRHRLPRRLPRRVSMLLGVTLSAQLAVLPVVLTTFGELAVVSVPANLIAVPAAIVAAAISFVASVVAVVSVEAASVVFAAAGPPATAVLIVARTLAGTGPMISLERPLGLALLAAVLAGWWGWQRPWLRRCAGAITLILVVVLGRPLLGPPQPDGLQITAIDVGQGDAYLLETPGVRVLIDAGEDQDAARWLRRTGRRDLDLVVVTHPHLDHIGGVPAVLERVRVDAVWYRPQPTDLPAVAAMFAAADGRDVPVRRLDAGVVVQVADLTIEVLHPPPGRPYRAERSELNDTSTVLRASWGEARVLLTGDIEAAAQRELLATREDQLRAGVVTVPHHGAATTDPRLLEAVGAHTALIGVGAGNRHGHPAPEILAVLDELGAAVVRTDQAGTTTVAVRPAPGSAGEPPGAPGEPASGHR